jgi:hypothetical protein
MNNDLLYFLLVQLYMFLVGTNYSFEIILFYMKTKCLMKHFLSIVELYFGYHICIDPIRASLCLHFLSVIFVLWLCQRVIFSDVGSFCWVIHHIVVSGCGGPACSRCSGSVPPPSAAMCSGPTGEFIKGASFPDSYALAWDLFELKCVIGLVLH